MELSPSVVRARNIITVLFVVLIVLDAALVLLSGDRWAIGRVIVTAGVMYSVLQGYRWAKWVLVGLLSLGVVALIGLLIASSKMTALLSVGSVVLIVLCCVVIGYLVGNQDFQQYLAIKRKS